MECKKIQKIHRRYPDTKWDYKALSCRTNRNGKPTDIIFFTLKNKGKSSKGVEVYSGKNYIVNSSSPSYSRKYNLDKVPGDISPIVDDLKSKHSKTSWSSEKKVDLN
ncbi:MAG: hypothetical protein AABY22_23490 [Nanoarchaeota archaeon]